MFFLTLYSSEAALLSLHLGLLTTKMIYPRLVETLPSRIPYFSSMSTFSTPSNQADNSPSNAPYDPVIELIALMTQKIHKNTTIMAELQLQYYMPLVPPIQMNFPSKIHCPPFPKWYGTPTTKSLFLAQVATYNPEAYYAGVQYWNQTATATKVLSVVISANMISNLPCDVYPIF